MLGPHSIRYHAIALLLAQAGSSAVEGHHSTPHESGAADAGLRRASLSPQSKTLRARLDLLPRTSVLESSIVLWSFPCALGHAKAPEVRRIDSLRSPLRAASCCLFACGSLRPAALRFHDAAARIHPLVSLSLQHAKTSTAWLRPSRQTDAIKTQRILFCQTGWL